MALPHIRYVEDETFRLDDGNEVYVTNKYSILSGPEEWLAPVGLASLAKAMREADSENTRAFYISSDPPDRFDARYPGHLLDIRLELSRDPKRLGVAVTIEREVDEEADVRQEFSNLLASLVDRHRGSYFELERNENAPEWFTVRFDIPTRGKRVSDALAIGQEAEALLNAAQGGRLSLQSAVDLVRTGHGPALVGQQEGPWFDGKGAPYVLANDAQKWELAKDVASFANSESGGLIFIGAHTKRRQDGDIIQSVTDFELSLVEPARYRSVLTARVHPRVEGLEVRTVSTEGTRGVAYIYIPPQREEVKPFVVKGVVVSSGVRDTHVSIPVRDGEDTRYADPAEVHSLLQAGRIALRRQ
ncbi:MAG: AlbA family DNA-binding domain-containing protein [Gaiellaceae bacterium]